jgi:hypothetical protein
MYISLSQSLSYHAIQIVIRSLDEYRKGDLMWLYIAKMFRDNSRIGYEMSGVQPLAIRAKCAPVYMHRFSAVYNSRHQLATNQLVLLRMSKRPNLSPHG